MSNLELNKGDNFIICADISMSMGTKDCGSMSRIEYMKEQLRTFATQASQWDEDGIDLITFGENVKVNPNIAGDKAIEIINGLKAVEASTDTAGAIRAAYKRHKETGSAQTFCMLFTDGEPNDRAAVKKAIVTISKELKDEHEFAISFITVGKIEPKLQEFLTELDDDLKDAPHDIVDVKRIEDVDFVAACAGALHD